MVCAIFKSLNKDAAARSRTKNQRTSMKPVLLQEMGKKEKNKPKKPLCPACALGTIYLVKTWCLLSLFITAFS